MFNIYDQNQDGAIDYKELKEAFRAIMIMADNEFKYKEDTIADIANNVLKYLDKDFDSKISLEEFIEGTLNNRILRDLVCPQFI